MQVGEVSERTGVSVRAIRYYERAGLLPARRLENGYREFEPSAVARVRIIRDLLETGFTVQEIVSLLPCLDDATRSTTRCQLRTAALYREKLARVDAQVRTLRLLRRRIQQRLATLDPV
jgi:DNA-binding transcriptional MerR regulator